MCRYVRYTVVFDVTLHICKDTRHRLCTCETVCSLELRDVGDPGGSDKALFAGVGRYF